jgi:deferrochelatase/peroxidase EfeB
VTEPSVSPTATPRVSRRGLLGLGGAAAGGLVVGGIAGAALADGGSAASPAGASSTPEVVPFHGTHQAGIATPVQDRLLFASFDVTSTSRDDLIGLLHDWTAAAEAMTIGRPVGGPGAPLAPPNDTGEATGSGAANLTLTFGIGPTLFDGGGVDRFGLAAKRPAALADLPAFAGDNLDPTRSGGDLCVQACGDDPQVLFHAIRNLTRIGRGVVRVRWVQEGFGRTSSTTSDQVTARNLMGFKDGTANIKAGTKLFDRNVWVARGDDPAWMRGGSYLVARRIRIRIEVWDRSSLQDQEQTIGRARPSGAPLGSTREFDSPDLTAKDAKGKLVIPADSHVSLANQDANKIHILRRGYNFTDGLDERVGQLDAGLFFIAYQRDPRRQFVPLQQKLAQHDALNEYVQHVSSALFAVFPGVGRGGWIGQTLLG